MTKIRLLVADDHQMFRAGIVNLLTKEANFEVVGEASDGTEAVELSQRLRPDVVLMDIFLPALDGIAATAAIKSKKNSARVLALSSSVDEQSVLKMLNAGANGYVLKDAPIDELVLAIKAISKGSSYFAREVAAKLFALLRQAGVTTFSKKTLKSSSLTDREVEILCHIAEEMTNKEIAAKLFISPRTVETHRRNLLNKLKVKNTAGLVKYYLHFIQNNGQAILTSPDH